MPTVEPTEPNQPGERRPRPHAVAGVCMSELLAACAAAEAISRPPRAPDPADARPAPRTMEGQRKAA
ncbi:hypothetical protein [Streptomyces carpinensis]|uniref:hypothetical protein n=1 Tax=Streptomyces carpinensis TaxID=66369 RepID=UPI000A3BE448|nr:hypothetical protein [Streptomyces carpinensis]